MEKSTIPVDLFKGFIKRIIIFPVLFYVYNKGKINKYNSVFVGLSNIYIFGTFLYFLFSLGHFGVFIRLCSYFQIVENFFIYFSLPYLH
jgi:hypothetical protein